MSACAGSRKSRGVTLARRRLTPAPCWVHPRDTRACTRPVAGRIASRSRVTRRAPVSTAQRSDADDGVQDQEQLDRCALAARATAAGRTVICQCECHVWKRLLHGALWLYWRACRELLQSSRALYCGPKACPASLILARACVYVGRVVWSISIKLQLTMNPPLSILSTVPFKITDL